MSSASSVAIVIPARYELSRFPGKPLHSIAGITMLERVWRIAKSTKVDPYVIVTSEDERVLTHARSFGAATILTSDKCENGTERVFEAVEKAEIEADIIVNLQGDAPLTPPWVLDAMVRDLANDKSVDIVTPAVELDDAALTKLKLHKMETPASGTTVVFDGNRNALYFSKNIIPYQRRKGFSSVYRHIGLYGYRKQSLARYIALKPGALEMTEGLEQLRALEHGMSIRVTVVDYKGRTHGSVDSLEDVAVVEGIIAAEGELF